MFTTLYACIPHMHAYTIYMHVWTICACTICAYIQHTHVYMQYTNVYNIYARTKYTYS